MNGFWLVYFLQRYFFLSFFVAGGRGDVPVHRWISLRTMLSQGFWSLQYTDDSGVAIPIVTHGFPAQPLSVIVPAGLPTSERHASDILPE